MSVSALDQTRSLPGSALQDYVQHDRILDDPGKWHGSCGGTPCRVFTHRDLPPIPGAARQLLPSDLTLTSVDRDGRLVHLIYGVTTRSAGSS